MSAQNAIILIQSSVVIVLDLENYTPAITPPKTYNTVIALKDIVPQTVSKAC